VTELRDSAIWAATCELEARVLRNDARPFLLRSSLPWLVSLATSALCFVMGYPVLPWVLLAVGVIPPLLTALVVRGGGHLMLEADGFTYRALQLRTHTVSVHGDWNTCAEFVATPGSPLVAPHVTWTRSDGSRGGTFIPGTGGLPPEDLAVLLNRYRQRYARPAPA
jgi:hypothetical protein